MVVVYLQLGIQPKEDTLTVEQAWDELVGRLSYLFSIEVCNSIRVKYGDAIFFGESAEILHSLTCHGDRVRTLTYIHVYQHKKVSDEIIETSAGFY